MNYKISLMMQHKKFLLVIPVIAIILGYSIFGTKSNDNVIPSSNDTLDIKGWVQVDIVREGKLIYHHEDRNLITNTGKDMIAKQMFIFNVNASLGGSNPNATTVIALGNSTNSPSASGTVLPTEINYGSLGRAIATIHHANTTSTITLRHLFTATASVTNVQQAGLYNSLVNATSTGFVAWNTFSSANLISGDQITITWTITLS